MNYVRSTCAGLVIATFSFSVEAAPRKVIAENFTATWCVYCPDVANGLIMLMEEFPDTFFPMQVHYTDSYDTSWAYDRMENFYGWQGLPNVWMDGVLQKLGTSGSASSNYNHLRSMYMQRQAASTDVTMEMCGEVVDSNTYTVGISVGIESSGSGKSMRIHCAQMLDNYPSSPSYNYSCFKQADSQLIALSPGETETISFSFDLDSTSTTNLSDVNFIAWAQTPNASGPAEVHQAEKHGYNAGDCQIDTFTVGTKGDFATIGEAMTASGTGDTVRVMPGTYYENIDFGGSGITLVSFAGPDVTIIDGGGNASVVWMTGVNQNAILDGFTIQNGLSAIGGGIFTDGSPTVKDCIFRDNTAKAWGGAIGSNNGIAMPTIVNTQFCNNSPDDIYGDWVDGGGNVFEDSCGAGDADGDGVSDDVDNCYLYNPDQADCNSNDIGDVCDIADGTSEDCNGNGTLDDCDIAEGGADCNGNGILDDCDIADGGADCNGNGTLDDCDIDDGGADCNGNGIPDDCELTDYDCNENGVLDDCESDCDANGIPDDCDIAGGAGDCNADGVPDSCQLTDNDCNSNGIPDECEQGDPCSECPADVSGDNYVDVTDLLAVIGAWGEANSEVDVNGDGIVDVSDLLEVVGSWGPCE